MTGITVAEVGDDVTLRDVTRQLAELTDLFRRRLVDDRTKNDVILALRQHLQAREAVDTGAAFESLFAETLLAIDRLESEETSPQLAASVSAELLEVLGRRGLRALPSEGIADPAIHEIVGRRSASGVESGAIVEVRRRGYLLGDRLLRPAQVIVAVEAPEIAAAGEVEG